MNSLKKEKQPLNVNFRILSNGIKLVDKKLRRIGDICSMFTLNCLNLESYRVLRNHRLSIYVFPSLPEIRIRKKTTTFRRRKKNTPKINNDLSDSNKWIWIDGIFVSVCVKSSVCNKTKMKIFICLRFYCSHDKSTKSQSHIYCVAYRFAIDLLS